MTSKKQIAANQQNAKKSTGPTTPDGKNAAKMNAITHGILSTHLFIPTSADTTDIEGFADFFELFFEEMQPVGIMESLLVDRLFATFWRLRRLHIAETGFIKKQIAPHYVQQTLEKIEAHGTARRDVENGFFRRMRTSNGCAYIATGWQVIVESLKEKGLPLSKSMASRLDWEFGGSSGFPKAEWVSNCNTIVNKKNIEPLSAEKEKQFNEWALNYAKDLQEFFEVMAKFLGKDEEEVRKGDIQSKMIPPLDQLDKIQRYDAHLQRIFLQTLHELQRIQSRRMGTPAPLPAALDVMLDNSNGFVS